jgi:hypothetical protein
MKYQLVVLGQLLVLFLAPAAQAQVSADVAKITCKQFAAGSIGRYGAVGYWLSGYLNAKQDNTNIDISGMKKNVKKLESYCRKHHETLVMDAAKSVFGLSR